MNRVVEWGVAFFTIHQMEFVTVFRLILAAVCGGIIGIERNMKGRPAGIRTFSLVCMGSALIMITNEYISIHLSAGTGDVTRMAAQVVSGIGFLGAGTIMVTGNNQIKGLTTAATLWVTASIGIAFGAGFYMGAITGIAIITLVSKGHRLLEKRVLGSSHFMTVYVEGQDEEFMLRLVEYFESSQIRVLSLQRKEDNKWYYKDTAAVIEINFGNDKTQKIILEDIKKIEGVRYIDEI